MEDAPKTKTAPAGAAESSTVSPVCFFNASSAPAGAGFRVGDVYHGLRSPEYRLAPPVATFLSPAGAEMSDDAQVKITPNALT